MHTGVDKKKVIGPIIVVALLFGYGGYKFYEGMQPESELLYGTVEAKAYDVSVQTAGIITRMLKQEGEAILSGEVVAEIDNRDSQLKKHQAELSLNGAENQLALLNEGSRDEDVKIQQAVVDQLKGQLAAYQQTVKKMTALRDQTINGIQQAQTLLEDRKKAYEDAKSLFSGQASSETSLEAAKLAYEQAEYGVKQALSAKLAADADLGSTTGQLAAIKAQLKAAEERLEVVKHPVLDRQFTAGAIAVEQAKSSVDLTSLLDERYKAVSKKAGNIQAIYFEEGEFVNVGATLATVIDSSDTWATFYATEKMLPKMALGQTIYMKSTANGIETTGTIVSIQQKAEFTPVSIVTTKDREKLVFRVKVSVDEVKGIQPGMMLAMALQKEALQ